MRFSQTYSK